MNLKSASFSLDKNNKAFFNADDFVKYTNHSIYLTGKAGTGKTTFLKYIKESTSKKTVVLAPTGLAAINAGGVTINSFFQLPFGPFIPNDERLSQKNIHSNFNYRTAKKKIIENLELLIIDEISMVRCDTLDVIDTLLRTFTKKKNLPFGGIQLLLIGDTFQLPPIAEDSQWEILSNFYDSPYFFHSKVFKQIKPTYIELKKFYRQKDKEFINLLNKVRVNDLSSKDLKKLNSNYRVDNNDKNYITLATHNSIVDVINTQRLSENTSKLFQFEAGIEGDFNENSYPTERILKLKRGAQIMFIKNDSNVEKQYFNGKLGIIKKLSSEEIIVECDNKERIKVSPEIWYNVKYKYDAKDKKIVEDKVGVFIQYPLRLAWAITVHKSQGLTFEKVEADLSDAFAPGQVYVALSRCTSLEGLILKNKIPQTAIKTDFNVLEFAKSETPETIIVDEIKNGKSNFYYTKAKEEYEKNNINKAYDLIKTALIYNSSENISSFYNILAEKTGHNKIKEKSKMSKIEYSEHLNKLERAKKIIEINYDLLLQYHNLNMDPKTIEETLLSQRKLTVNMIDDLCTDIDKNDDINELTENWWESLTDDWKELILFNIDFIPKYHGDKSYQPISGLKNSYKSIVGSEYVRPKIVDVKKTLLELSKLKKFLIDEIENDLTPISKLTNIENLELFPFIEETKDYREFRGREYDLSPLAKLKNLQSLEITDNESDINPLYELTQLSVLTLYPCKLNDSILNFKNLKSLTCNSGNLPLISKMTDLKELDLVGIQDIDLKPVTKLKNLEKFGCGVWDLKVERFHHLLKLRKIKEVSIGYSTIYKWNKGKFKEAKNYLDTVSQLKSRGVKVS